MMKMKTTPTKPAADNSGHVPFLLTTTALGLGIFGWTLPGLLDVHSSDSPRTFLGLYMLAGASGAIVGDSTLYWIVRLNRRRFQPRLDAAMKRESVATAFRVIGSSAYGTTKEVQMKAGQKLKMPGYTLTYLGPKVVPTLTESGSTTTTTGAAPAAEAHLT